MWMLFGALSIVFTMLNLFWDPKRKSSWCISICAFAFPMLTMLAHYTLLNNWVDHEDWSALMDVVPSTSLSLTCFVLLMIALDAVSMLKYRPERRA